MFILIAFYLLAWASCRAALSGNSKFAPLNILCLLVSAGSVGAVVIKEHARSGSITFVHCFILAFLIVAAYRDATDDESEKIFVCMLVNTMLAFFIILQIFF